MPLSARKFWMKTWPKFLLLALFCRASPPYADRGLPMLVDAPPTFLMGDLYIMLMPLFDSLCATMGYLWRLLTRGSLL